MRSELDLFSSLPTQVNLDDSRFVKYYPVTNIDRSAPLEFLIKVPEFQYLDVASTIYFLKTKIVKTDGTNLGGLDADGRVPAGSKCFPINLYHATQFKSLEVYLNNTLISSADNLYAYRAYLETLLTYSPKAKEEHLTTSLWYKDNPPVNENADGLASANKGAVARFGLTKYSRSFESFGRIHSEIFSQPRFLMPGSELRIRFLRADNDFSLMAASEDIKLRVLTEKAYLLVKHCDVSSSVRLAHEAALLTSRIKYPIDKVRTRFYTKGAGHTDISLNSLVSGTLPKKIVIGFVASSAFNGKFKENPFNFESLSISSIVLRKNGQGVPFEELKMDWENGNYLEGYMSFLHGTGRLYSDTSIGIRPFTDYKNGYTLFCFDLSPDQNSNDGSVNLIREGKISCEMTLGVPTPYPITILAMMSYDDIIEIDKEGIVYY
jgi:hypothetical protein